MKTTTANRSLLVSGVIECHKTPRVASAILQELAIKHPVIFTRLYKDYLTKQHLHESGINEDLRQGIIKVLGDDPLVNKIRALKFHRDRTNATLGDALKDVNAIISSLGA